MKRCMGTVLTTGLLLLVMTGRLEAASLGLSLQAPELGSSATLLDYFEFGPDGDLSSFGAVVDTMSGAAPVGQTILSFGLGFSLAAPELGPTGGFDILDDNGVFLSGELAELGYTTDVIEAHFSNLSGDGAVLFGSTVLMRIVFEDLLGENPFTALVDGQSYGAAVMVSNVVTPVPVPAVPPAMLAAVAGWVLMRWGRRKLH